MSVRGFFHMESRRSVTMLVGWAWSSWRGSLLTRDDPVARKPPIKKLIEFGWDEPDTAFLRRHVAEMEKTPFDGCVFHVMSADPQGRRENFTWLCWGGRAFTEAELEPALDDLRATTFRRFTHNFLRFNTSPGDLDWFDDHAAVLSNARLAAAGRPRGQVRGHPLRRGGVPGRALHLREAAGREVEVVGRVRRPGAASGSGGHGGVPGGLPRPDRPADVRSQPAPAPHPRGASRRWRRAATGSWPRSSTGWSRRRRATPGSWTASSFPTATRSRRGSTRATG